MYQVEWRGDYWHVVTAGRSLARFTMEHYARMQAGYWNYGRPGCPCGMPTDGMTRLCTRCDS